MEVRKSNVFEAVKQSVTTRQAAEIYGVPVGRNGMACCPFYKGAHLVCRTHQKGIRSNTYDIIPREEWEVIEGCHEAIVTPEEWEQVQEVRIVYNFVGEIPEIAA